MALCCIFIQLDPKTVWLKDSQGRCYFPLTTGESTGYFPVNDIEDYSLKVEGVTAATTDRYTYSATHCTFSVGTFSIELPGVVCTYLVYCISPSILHFTGDWQFMHPKLTTPSLLVPSLGRAICKDYFGRTTMPSSPLKSKAVCRSLGFGLDLTGAQLEEGNL